MLLRTFSIVVFVVACGPKVKPRQEVQPLDPLPPGATTRPPGLPTGTVVHLECDGLNPTACQTIDYTFDASYDREESCRWRANDNVLVFKMKSTTSSTADLTLQISSFTGAGTYPLADDSNYLALGQSVTYPAGGGCAGGAGTASLRSAKYTCGPCSAIVTDVDPAAPYPKTLGVSVTCANLCEENAWKCTPPINIQLSQTCTR